MNRKILPLLIAGLTVGSYANAETTLYGKMNVSLNNYDIEGAVSSERDNWELESNASRVGVKGSMQLTDSLKAIYKAEYEIFVDDGDDGSSNEFKQRNIYAGIQGSAGTLIAGKHDSPVKLAQGKVDLFNDLPMGDIKNYVSGETRASDIVIYTTPTIAGFSLSTAFIPGEDVEDNNPATDEEDGLADGTSISLGFKTGGLRLALAVDDEVESGSGNFKGWATDITRVVGEYKAGPVKLGALFQQAELSDTDPNDAEEDSYVLSAAYKCDDKTTLKLQYGETEIDSNAGDEELTQLAFGLDYNFNKKAKVFVYYANIESELEIGSDDEDTTFAFGYELKF